MIKSKHCSGTSGRALEEGFGAMGKPIPLQQTRSQEVICALSIGASDQTEYSGVGTSN